MKKLTAGIFATLLTVVSVGAANANIASQGYVDEQVGTVTTALGNKADKTELSNYATTSVLTSGLAGKLDKEGTAAKATADAAGNVITDTYATKTELGAKADASALENYVTTEDANTNYAAKSTEGVANTASTTAQSALTNIGTLSNLTTDAKKNTVEAINEVASEAATAQSTATAAQGAAEAAQGDVDALEVRVGTAETDIDGIQGKLENMATSETVSGLQTDVAGLKTSKLDKTTYDSQVGTVSAGNMGTTATTVVTAIKEVASEAEAAQSAASAADTKASQAQTTANAAIPKVNAEGSDGKYVLTATAANGVATYKWELIERGAAEK